MLKHYLCSKFLIRKRVLSTYEVQTQVTDNLYRKSQNKMKLLIITIILLGIGIAGIAIKIWAKKDGKFAGTCASQNPMLNKEGEACGFCGKTPDQFSDCNEPQHT